MNPVIVATVLVCWYLVNLLLGAAWSAGVIQHEPEPTRGVVRWLTRIAINGALIWAVIYLART